MNDTLAAQNAPEAPIAPTTAVAEVKTPAAPTLPDRPFNESTASLVELKEIARLFAVSSQFKDIASTNPAQAFTKMMIGRDLGVPMTRALLDIQMIQGKPTLSANLLAGMIKKSGRYKFKKLVHTDQECSIQVWEKIDGTWEDLGVSSFTMADATRAGLTNNPTWKKFPKNMLFSRVISNIAKQECGDIFLGSVYTPDELDTSIQCDENGDPIVPKARVTKVENNGGKDASGLPIAGYVQDENGNMVPYVKARPAADVTDAEVIEAPAGEETVTTVAREIEALATETKYDLPRFLRESKIKSLTSLDLASLKNHRNNLRQRKKTMAVA